MDLCFLTGSAKDENGERTLRTLASIEYLHYDLTEGKVRIANDFFICNNGSQPRSLRCLHRSALPMHSYVGDWSNDRENTALLSLGPSRELGLSLRKAVTCNIAGPDSAADESERFSLLEDTEPRKRNIVTEEVPSCEGYMPYTMIDSPPIQPGDRKVYRVCGTLEGCSYAHLMQDYLRGGEIAISGGAATIKSIREELNSISDYPNRDMFKNEFECFVDDYYEIAQRFFVMTEETSGAAILQYCDLQDAYPGRINANYRGRKVSWFWSDTSFAILLSRRPFSPIVRMYHGNKVECQRSFPDLQDILPGCRRAA